MNKSQTEEINRINSVLVQTRADIDMLREEIKEQYEELSEARQESTQGEALTALIDLLEQASDNIDLVISDIIEALQHG